MNYEYYIAKVDCETAGDPPIPLASYSLLSLCQLAQKPCRVHGCKLLIVHRYKQRVMTALKQMFIGWL